MPYWLPDALALAGLALAVTLSGAYIAWLIWGRLQRRQER